MKQRSKQFLLALFLVASDQGIAQEAKATLSGAEDSPPKISSPDRVFVNPERTDNLLNSLSDTMRDSGSKNQNVIRKSIKAIFDMRLPLVFESCDTTVNFEVLRLAYAYVSEQNGAEFELKRFADAIYKLPDAGYLGVSKKCSAALRGYSIAFLQVYLGKDWSQDDENKLKSQQSNQGALNGKQ